MTLIKSSFVTLICLSSVITALCQTGLWMKYEKTFESTKTYANPLYEVARFQVRFQSPSGRIKIINGFWDGHQTWRVRFAPDEVGQWRFTSVCSDTLNRGLHAVKGTFDCISHKSPYAIYTKGSVIHPKGSYYLTHADGTPFFYAACTAWNGTLKSTESEWKKYLEDRVLNHYNVIQFTTTQWRGGDKNSEGHVAFEGSGRISINPAFFQHLDKKIDEINRHGLVAAPVLLWALPVSTGRELSPGYYLPEPEAILLANYMVARYSGNQVIWILGGDGKYIGEYEQRWKTIGRAVFGGEHPGTVALHSQGRSWIGKEYANEDWLDILGYQTGHNSTDNTINWITKGPVTNEWYKLPPKVLINMEPCYEDINPSITSKEVRNASYWSVFSTPVAGITYGANGIWPWIRSGEKIANHATPAHLRTWEESINFPGSVQIGQLADFIRQYNWWQLKPAPELVVHQPEQASAYLSLVRSDDCQTIMVYVPTQMTVQIYNIFNVLYQGQWYDPVGGHLTEARLTNKAGIIEVTSPKNGDMVLVLKKK